MPQKKKGKPKKKSASVPSGPPTGPKSSYFCLKGAGSQFWEAAGKCPYLEHEESDQGGDKAYTIPLTPAALEAVLSWFAAGASAAGAVLPMASAASGHPKALCLHFLSSSEKRERALIHSVVEARFSATLKAVSQGLGEERTVAVFMKGQAPEPTADEALRAQGARLYKYARDAGLMEHSQDELVERLATGTLTDVLKHLWETRSAEQEAVQNLLQAVAQDDASAIEALCAKMPGVVNVAHMDSSELPLLAAARLNCAAAAEALLKRGANVEAKCPATNRTALKVARMFEATEVEGFLLRMGAHDPEASSFPIPDESTTSFGHPAGSQGAASQDLSGTPAACDNISHDNAFSLASTAPPLSIAPARGSSTGATPDSGGSTCPMHTSSRGYTLWPTGISGMALAAAAVVGLGLIGVLSMRRSRSSMQ